MAGRNDISKYVHEVSDESTWNFVLEASDEKLIVVDCHQGWCGRCEAVMPTFQRLFLDHPNAEKRIAIACVPLIEPFSSYVQNLIPTDAHINVSKMGCLPLFLMLRGKVCVGVIQGVDTPGIVAQVGMNIPENKASEDEIV